MHVCLLSVALDVKVAATCVYNIVSLYIQPYTDLSQPSIAKDPANVGT